MKDIDRVANKIQVRIIELIKVLNDLGYDFKLTHDGISCETRKRDDSEISKIEELALEKSSCKDDYIYKLDNPEKDVEEK